MSERTCPKCGYEQPDYHTECAHCGIIFAKYVTEADSFLRATQSVPPEPTARVRPFTLFLLLAYLALGWYAIHYFGIVDKLAVLRGREADVSYGGVTNVRQRQRINLPAPAPLEEEAANGVACYGIPLFPDASGAADASTIAGFLHAVRYETTASMDEVTAFYDNLLGAGRMRRVAVEIPEGSPLAASLGEVRGRRTRWYVRVTNAADQSTDVDLVLQNPFFDDSGRFRPAATSITCIDVGAHSAAPDDAAAPPPPPPAPEAEAADEAAPTTH